MKIIHCSDLHLDADLRSRFDQEAARQRRAELLHTFRRLCGYARRSSVGCILICGDLFDTQTP
ncbi:MAG: metallophosphoesterase family protein, partial [Lachnospiraceae bacterium]